jgi:AAA family ATP:ADP antiporter
MALVANINRVLSIEKGEEQKVYLLLAQSFFFGIFFATFEISAFTMFQGSFGQESLYESFIVSGIAGVILSLLYSKLQASMPFIRLALFNLVFISALMAIMWTMTRYTSSKYVVFLAFVMMGPLNAIAQLGFWGMAGRLFNLRQGKRLFGLVDSGQTFGMIVISFSVPFLLVLFSSIGDLLLVSSISAFGALLIQLIISKKFGISIIEQEQSEKKERLEGDNSTLEKKKGMSIMDVLRHRYLNKLALFVVFSMLGAFLIYSSFFDVTKVNYPDDNERAVFLSMFLAAVMIFSFIIKVFLFGKLTNMYGVKVSLLLTPIVVGVIIASAALIGTFLGYTPDSENFTLFFLMVCMGRLFSHALSMSIEGPTTKILYQPIDKKVRYDAQSKIDGTVNEFSSVLSGVVLLGLSKLSFFESLHINYLVVAVIVVWSVIIIKLYQGYRETLQETLSTSSSDSEEVVLKRDKLVEGLASEIPDKVIYSCRMIEKVEPVIFENIIAQLINHSAPKVREYIIRRIKEGKIYSAIPIVRKRMDVEDAPLLQEMLMTTLERLYLHKEEALTYDYLELLVKSRGTDKKEYAAKIIGELITDDTVPLLIDLLKDLEPKVRIAAILTASKSHKSIFWPYLVDSLWSPVYRGAASTALLNIGEVALADLNEGYYKSGIRVETQVDILSIIGEIGGNQAKGYLVDKLLQSNKILLNPILIALKSCGYQSDEGVVSQVNKVIEQIVKTIIWNLAAIEEVNENYAGGYVIEALREENRDKMDMLFLLLSLNYEPTSIEKIKDSINTGTVESIGYAIELLDLFLGEELKGYLFPLLEDSLISDKLKQIEIYYSRASYSSKEVLIEIINRDFNYTNSWTKACAILQYGQLEKKELDKSLIACLFNPDKLLAECASEVVFRLDPVLYHESGKRLNSRVKREMDKLVASTSTSRSQLLIEKTFLLKKVKGFGELSWQLISAVARITSKVSLSSGEILLSKERGDNTPFYILLKGVVGVISAGEKIVTIENSSVISDVLLLDTDVEQTEIKALTDTVLFQISQLELFNFLYDYPEFSEVIISTIDLRLEPKGSLIDSL